MSTAGTCAVCGAPVDDEDHLPACTAHESDFAMRWSFAMTAWNGEVLPVAREIQMLLARTGSWSAAARYPTFAFLLASLPADDQRRLARLWRK